MPRNESVAFLARFILHLPRECSRTKFFAVHYGLRLAVARDLRFKESITRLSLDVIPCAILPKNF